MKNNITLKKNLIGLAVGLVFSVYAMAASQLGGVLPQSTPFVEDLAWGNPYAPPGASSNIPPLPNPNDPSGMGGWQGDISMAKETGPQGSANLMGINVSDSVAMATSNNGVTLVKTIYLLPPGYISPKEKLSLDLGSNTLGGITTSSANRSIMVNPAVTQVGSQSSHQISSHDGYKIRRWYHNGGQRKGGGSRHYN